MQKPNECVEFNASPAQCRYMPKTNEKENNKNITNNHENRNSKLHVSFAGS